MSAHDVACIVLAAGGSSRFGSQKLLHVVDGTSLVRHAVGAAFESGVKTVVLVVGSAEQEILAAVSEFETLVIVRNPEWKSGLASSLRAGLAAVQDLGRFEAVLITVSDQPLVGGSSLGKLLSTFECGHRVVASGYNGVAGVPALIGWEYMGEIMSLNGDRGAGPWLRKHQDRVTLVEMPEASIDIDTPSDIDRLRGIRPT